MKKLWSAVLAVFAAMALAVPAFADAALPPYYYPRRSLNAAAGWVISILIALVLVAVAIIILAVKYKREQDAAEQAARAAAAKKPDEQ